MAVLLLLLQEHTAAGGGRGPFTIEGGLILWTLVVFSLLLVILWRFGWPAIVASVEEREKKIAQQLADAEKANAEAARLLEEHKKTLAGARAEAQEMITKAKAVAAKEAELLLAKTRGEQEQMLERARRDIEAEKEKAIVALRREAVDLSIAAASRLVESNLDSDANRRLVMEYLAGVGKTH